MSILPHFKRLKESECLCGASELIVKNIGTWNQKVGHPYSKLSKGAGNYWNLKII